MAAVRPLPSSAPKYLNIASSRRPNTLPQGNFSVAHISPSTAGRNEVAGRPAVSVVLWRVSSVLPSYVWGEGNCWSGKVEVGAWMAVICTPVRYSCIWWDWG